MGLEKSFTKESNSSGLGKNFKSIKLYIMLYVFLMIYTRFRIYRSENDELQCPVYITLKHQVESCDDGKLAKRLMCHGKLPLIP